MALPNPLYIAFQGLETYFVNKDDGSPLSGGYVKFFSDVNRTVEKDVYQQVQLSDNTYRFVNIGSIVTLTAVGTFGSPTDGTDIQVYAFPYDGTEDAPGNPELYYLQVYSSGDVLQFTREAQPANFAPSTNPTDTFEASENQISNPQFVEVLFTPDPAAGSFTYAATGVDFEVAIAPDWSIVTSGAGNVVIKQTAVSDAALESNPPYFLDINTTGSISSVKLRQRFQGDPRLLLNGFISTTIEVASVSSEAILFAVNYVPSAGTYSKELLNGFTTNNSQFTTLSHTVSTTGTGESSATAPTGYVDIEIVWPALKNIQITSIQIASVQNESSSVEFIEQSTARQVDHLFHYYKPELEYKPIPSMLAGWDFPLNPAQALGSSVTMNTTAAYIWDQTICKSVVGNIAVIRNTVTGGFQATTANAAEAFYQLQYLSGAQAQEILGKRLAVNISAFRTQTGGACNVKVYLYRGNAASSFPVLPTSLGTLAADGVFTLTAVNWTLIPRGSLGQALGSLSTVDTSDYTTLNDVVDLNFSGWELDDSTQIADTNKFAMVVTYSCPTTATVVTINSIGLMAGDIATRPAPQSLNAAYADCYYYYQKSFPNQTVPAQNAGQNGAENSSGTITSGGAIAINIGPVVTFPVTMRTDPTVVLYNPSAANAFIYNITKTTSFASSSPFNTTTKGFSTSGNSGGAISSSDLLAVQWTADARLGIV